MSIVSHYGLSLRGTGHYLPADIWSKDVDEARTLATRLTDLDKTHKFSDLDFFITAEGKIKIIDIQLDKNEDFVSVDSGFPEGLEDLKLMFDL